MLEIKSPKVISHHCIGHIIVYNEKGDVQNGKEAMEKSKIKGMREWDSKEELR